jgi:hypothetical protein
MIYSGTSRFVEEDDDVHDGEEGAAVGQAGNVELEVPGGSCQEVGFSFFGQVAGAGSWVLG